MEDLFLNSFLRPLNIDVEYIGEISEYYIKSNGYKVNVNTKSYFWLCKVQKVCNWHKM